jgi:hypothetical protein
MYWMLLPPSANTHIHLEFEKDDRTSWFELFYAKLDAFVQGLPRSVTPGRQSAPSIRSN